MDWALLAFVFVLGMMVMGLLMQIALWLRESWNEAVKREAETLALEAKRQRLGEQPQEPKPSRTAAMEEA